MYWTKASFFCLLGVAVLSAKNADAQDNSPYSRFGLGEISRSENAVNLGMGGVAQAYGDAQSINFVNPASYSRLQLVTFDVGVHGGARRLTSRDAASSAGYGTLSYLQLGMPLGPKWGLNLGIRPLTKVSYNIGVPEDRIFFDTLKVASVNQFEGSGGIYQAYVGSGIGFGGFSVGVNVGYIFGNVTNSTKVLFPSNVDDPQSAIVPSRDMKRTSYGSFFYTLGLQQSIKLGKDLNLQLGVSGNLEQKLSAKRERLQETLLYDASSQEYDTRDTVKYTSGDRGDIIYPQSIGGGIMLSKTDKFSFGIDYTTSKWSNFRNYGAIDSTQDSWRMAFGGQFVPNAQSFSGYWNKVTYRLGGYFGKDNVKLAGMDMNTLGFSIGAGFPVRRIMPAMNQFTMINAAFEVGSRGNVDQLRETFYRLTIGFTLSDRWFLKAKYD
ncbi:hypothetical protein [Chitinophaga rhizosphaerae]|uniref:hypothetical protein n=1 Tax=Chitinophaga rhizosphaerae TaxID=1864947 RepID=UPI000F80427D|nr:hypothetical protein [Chitinophaga rhizosphaerae]